MTAPLRTALVFALLTALTGCERETLLGYQRESTSDGGFDPKGINNTNDGGHDGGEDGGCDWTPGGLGLVPVSTMIGYGDQLYAGSSGGRVYVTTGFGGWETISLPNAADTALSSILGPDGLLVGTDHGAAVTLVSDGGFEALDTGLTPGVAIRSFAIVSGGTLAGTSDGTYRVQSSGGWTPGTLAREDGGIVDVMAMYGSPPVVVAGTRADGMFRSDNNGQSWVHVGPSSIVPISTNGLVGIVNAGPHLFAGGDVFLISDDEGQSWQDVTNLMPISGGARVTAMATFGDRVYVAFAPLNGDPAEAYWSTDGTHWNTVGSPISDGPITSLFVYAGQLVAGTQQNGVLVYPLSCQL